MSFSHSSSLPPASKGHRPLALGVLCAALVVLAGTVIALSPAPIALWWQHPRQAFWLAQGLNPDPVHLWQPAARPLSAVARLGKKLFHDKRLSGSGKLACASCHSPDHAYGPPNQGAVMLGGPHGQTPGVRAVPSLRYLYDQPPFSIGPDAESDNDHAPSLAKQVRMAQSQTRAVKSAVTTDTSATNLVPQGGLFWDGRVNTLQQQATVPLFNPIEMDGGAAQRVARVLKNGGYASVMHQLFGPNVFRDPKQTVAEAMFAIGRYQMESRDFHPFNSQYDHWLAGDTRLSPAQMRGYLAFNDPNQGNCAACHLDKPTRDGRPPLFTDFQYEALGVPRNSEIPANRDPNYHDLGICGPYRDDMKEQTQYCGMFLTPSLRNVATRHVFFHNGVFHSLKDVLDWYVNRDTHPERFYPKNADDKVEKYNDIPVRYRTNVDTTDAPLNRHPGQAPALTPAQEQDIIAFLKTLTDQRE